MKLYYAPQTRALRALIMLEELAVPYEIVLIDFKGGEHKRARVSKNSSARTTAGLAGRHAHDVRVGRHLRLPRGQFPDKRMAPALGTSNAGCTSSGCSIR